MPSSKRKHPSRPEAAASSSTPTPKAAGRGTTSTPNARGSADEADDRVSGAASTRPAGREVLHAEKPRAGHESSEAVLPTVEPTPPRTRRHVQPVGPRVLVRIRDVPQRLESGLYLPANAVSTLPEAVLAEVVEVARTQPKTEPLTTREDDHTDDEADSDEVTLGENVSGIPLGALVLFGRDHGIRVPWDDRLRLVEVRHILAIVDEIPEDALQ